MRTIIFLLLMATPVFGQSIEMVYLPTEAAKVVQFKKALPGEIGATNALSLRNISEKRKNAYIEKISSFTAAVVFGEGALKAVEQIDFPIPLFIINGNGQTAATDVVVVLLDETFKGTAGNAVTVTSLDDIPQLSFFGRVVLKCQGIQLIDALNAMISTLE